MRTKQSKANREARAAGKARQVRSSALGKLLIMLAVVAAIVFGVAIFFKVNTIEVQGNSVYSADQIIEASQIQQGDNLLTVNKALAVGNIKAALPYVEDVSIARSLPDGIIIQVRESVISFAVMTDTNACWLIGPGGKALERIEPAAFNENPHINGLLISSRRFCFLPHAHGAGCCTGRDEGIGRHRPSGAYPCDRCRKGIRHDALV